MSSTIRVLDEHTINQMAAGEVIENPASVVKELVENSLDAGSTEITVELKGGGRQLIRVTDNGCGMNSDDALLCFERHATSKVGTFADLTHVSTMGFRGEAIPSIASISDFSLLTSPKSSQQGTLVLVKGGKVLKSVSAACSSGTSIEIKSLFYNVPVRKKFQRSPQYDAQEVQKVMHLFALGRPTVRFELIHNQKTLLSTRLGESLSERMAQLLGDEVASQTIPLSFSSGNIHIEGYLGLPTLNRQNRTGQYLFINGRSVVSHLVSRAVLEGYGTMLASNRYPLFILYLNLDGEELDVNVHPQKREVRFRQPFAIKEATFNAVDQALQSSGIPFEREVGLHTFSQFPARPAYTEMVMEYLPEQDVSKTLSVNESPDLFVGFIKNPTQAEKGDDTNILDKLSEEDPHYTSIPSVINTIKGYILIDPKTLSSELKGGICIVDQRSAHARIIYEKLLAAQGKPLEMEPFLIPYTFDADSIQATIILDHLDKFHAMGIPIEPFGEKTFIIHALPTIFGNTDIKRFITDLVSMVEERDSTSQIDEEWKKRLAVAASRSAVSAQKTLSIEEGDAMIKKLFRCKHPHSCPKGKATWVHINEQRLEKLFQDRVW